MSDKFQVLPTGKRIRDNQYKESTLTELFSTTVNISLVEKQLIWQRYSAMLLANSIVLGFITNALTGDETRRFFLLLIGACAFGIILCVLWGVLNHAGWSFEYSLDRHARKFTWYKSPKESCKWSINPMNVGIYRDVEEGRTDWIRVIALGTVLLFILAYVVVLV
jgi:hypothetical protein